MLDKPTSPQAPSVDFVPVGQIDAASIDRRALASAYRATRAETERLAAPLSEADQTVQSMPDASPTKWHRAHVTWFFEEFVLKPHAAGYVAFDTDFAFLFNSYYVGAGPRHARPSRGMLTRPGVSRVTAYRAAVDAAMLRLIEECDEARLRVIAPLITLGLNHEQQHQELLITDILHLFAQSPLRPAYDTAWRAPPAKRGSNDAAALSETIVEIGHAGGGFCFDNELPRHRALVGAVRLAKNLVTNGEWKRFITDGGYRRPELWLSDAWATVEREGWIAPGYWETLPDGSWAQMSPAGLLPVEDDAPVRHVSYYEADAFARWAGKWLPTEFEWEAAAAAGLLDDAFGQVWQWTRSDYAPYPAYRAPEGTIGEYNGKFMVSQYCLRGSSIATPAGHERLTYRNFFYPQQRWQFTGLRLADYSAA